MRLKAKDYMKFETLAKHHAKKLLDFELENKSWFESLIEARESSFYTHKGVTNHIESLIKKMELGTGYSGVLLHNNLIVARANLKDITSSTATVGYRVAKKSTSKGFASYCLVQVLNIAQSRFGVQRVIAQVLENNPASMQVLQKHKFQTLGKAPNDVTFNNKKLCCTQLELKYA